MRGELRLYMGCVCRPRLDGTSATVLEWKKERLEERICKMSCNTFRVYFKRLCLVAGMEKPPRPYFLQIGAGANFEGKAALHFFRRVLCDSLGVCISC